ncbi:hypothetical protein [Hymenobacter volaticus]|uniref:Uncharacterized protein n=1 Tax=Hymenobacter volaticus TaxID=2932254 RepID=A0ABY4GDA6_9BACT|nr:hypothetical protein [Hymenobacter volaticus]UOQ68771.1 hypothetical protein MUN86_25135 [Hymenobacter volaticus]
MERPQTLEQRQQAALLSMGARQTKALQQPPYTPGFAEWLAYEFVSIAPSAVPEVLTSYFPAPDKVDCCYLASVLQQIEQTRSCEREVGCGVDFVFGSIEYGAQHMARARQWLTTTEACLAGQTASGQTK